MKRPTFQTPAYFTQILFEKKLKAFIFPPMKLNSSGLFFLTRNN